MAENTLTPANEDYLETIYILSHHSEDGSVRSVDIAEEHDVSKASVNNAVTTLKNAGYINQSHYGRIELTKEGKAYGKSVYERHMLIKNFLISQLGVSEEVAEQEACEMEHAVSQDTARRWTEYLKVCSGCPLHEDLPVVPADSKSDQ